MNSNNISRRLESIIRQIDKLTESKAWDVISTAYAMPQGENKRLAQAVADVLSSANEKLFQKIREQDL